MKLVALAAIVAALVVPSALAATPTLTGTVGPGFTITLKKGTAKVTKLKAGAYIVKDRTPSPLITVLDAAQQQRRLASRKSVSAHTI